MIRQRNIDPVSFVGIEELERLAIVPQSATTVRFGTTIANAQKIQLVDLTVSYEVAITGGGTIGWSVNRTNGNTVAPSGAAGEVLITQPTAGDIGLLASKRYDLSQVPPIDVANLYANGLINLNVKMVPSGGVFTTGTLNLKLRYRPYLIGKDV